MPITQRKVDNLVETELTTKRVEDVKQSKGSKPSPKSKPVKKSTESGKKSGFVASTLQELSKVSWPSFRYTYGWSVVIVLFTLVTSLFLGAFDYLFTQSIKFVDCTSPQGQSRQLGECAQELGRSLTFQDPNV